MIRKIIFVLFICGFLFRLWFINLVPQPFVYDQYQYLGFAQGIIKEGLHADAYRLYGYPVLVAPLLYFFGANNSFPWQVFQAFIDATTALLIYIIARKLFKNSKIALTSYIFYILNPFTSAYVGVMLSEVVSIFTITLICLLFLMLLGKKDPKWLFIISLVLGFTPQIRPSFLIFTAVVLLSLIYLTFKFVKARRDKLLFALFAIILYIIPFTYNIFTNIKNFHQFSILAVDNVPVRELYTSLYVERGLPSDEGFTWNWPKEAMDIWNEYSLPKTSLERKLMADKYLDLAIKEIKRDPQKFIVWRVKKLWYIWEKHYLFPYVNVAGTTGKLIIYWGNIMLLLLGLIGFIKWVYPDSSTWKESSRLRRGFGGQAGHLPGVLKLCVFLFSYITLFHIFSTSEERFSLPAYPMLILFAGNGLWKIYSYLKLSRLKYET